MVSVELTDALSVGLARPLFLLALPLGAAAAWALIYRAASGAASMTSRRWLLAARVAVVALVVVTILSVQGFGFLMPGEIRMYFEMTSDDPDPGVISAIGKQNAMLGGVQGLFQLVLIADMVYLRYGGF